MVMLTDLSATQVEVEMPVTGASQPDMTVMS